MTISTKPLLIKTLETMGSDVTFHREDGGDPCLCRTPEGFRDPAWHRAHPEEPVCNEQGFLTTALEVTLKAIVQPAYGGQALSRMNQAANRLLGDIQVDDKLGVFPCVWGNTVIDFTGWSEAGEDYILYDGDRYIVVAYDKLADINGDTDHHWECGLRLARDRSLA